MYQKTKLDLDEKLRNEFNDLFSETIGESQPRYKNALSQADIALMREITERALC